MMSHRVSRDGVVRLGELSIAISTSLQQEILAETHLAETHESPISQARVYMAGGDAAAALTVLEPWRLEVEARGWADERLKVMIVQAVALQAHGDRHEAVHALDEALALAQPGAFVRNFC